MYSGLVKAGILANISVRFSRKNAIVLDFGANVGGGYGLLTKFFPPSKFSYHLFEPNDDCIPVLKDKFASKVFKPNIFNVAVYTQNTQMSLYGFIDGSEVQFPQGASLVANHNSAKINIDETKFKTVECWDIVDIINDAVENYDIVIAKFDIEGAELEVLTRIIESNLLDALYITFCEFHSQYLNQDERKQALKKEKWITSQFVRHGKHFFIWD